MSLIQTPWTSQPQQAVGIDWGNPITRGLVLAENLANPFFDGLGKTNTVVGTKVSASAVGMVTGFGSSGVGTTDSIQTQLTTHSVQRSYFALALANGSAAGGDFGRILDKRVSGAQVELIFRDDSAGTTTFSRAWTSDGSWFFTNPPAGQWHKYLVRYDASSTANYPVIQVNGVRQSLTVSTTPSGSLVNTDDAFVIGNRKNDSARNWSGQIALVLIWDRILNDNEARAINENPWQIFKPLPRRIFVPLATGGGTTAVTADHNASYTITGSVAADASAAYAIRAAVTADATASYALRAAVAADSAASYALRAAAQADQAAAYAIRAAVASDLAGSYAIQTAGTVTTGLDAAYAVRGSVAGDISVGYQIAAAVQAEVAAAYAVRAAVQKDLAAGYAIQAGLSAVSADLIAAYAVDGSTTTRAPSGAGPSIILPGSTRPGSLQTSGRPPNLGGRRH